MTERSEDLPSDDAPADGDLLASSGEPDPAEVAGSDDDPATRDASLPPTLDPADEYRQDTLDQRLAEEEPDKPRVDGNSDDDEAAEEAAIHDVPDDRL